MATPVSHEYPCRIGIKPHKTEQPANGGERDQRDGRPSGEPGKVGDTAETQQRLTAGQPIQTVGVIHGIDHADHRENGKRPANCRGYRHPSHERQMGDEHIPVIHHRNHGDKLADELHVMPQFPAVIHDAEPEQYQCPENIGFQRWVERQQQNDRQQSTEHNTDAANPGNRNRMHLARVRPVDHPEARCKTHHNRYGHHTDHQRGNQRQYQHQVTSAGRSDRYTDQILQMKVDDRFV